MQSATAVHVMPVQNAARQARCTSTNGTAAGYMMSSCASSRRGSGAAAGSALPSVEEGFGSGVLNGAGAPGAVDDAGVLRGLAVNNEAARLDRPRAAAWAICNGNHAPRSA